MPGPGDEMAAGAARRGLRASDADRDRAVDVLKAAFVAGRLAKDEFDLRVGQALAARTQADLGALTAGIPAEPAPQVHRRDPVARASSPGRRRVPGLIFPVAGVLLLVGGMALASTVAFIAGMLVVAASAPQALPCSHESATVRMWQRLHRRQAG